MVEHDQAVLHVCITCKGPDNAELVPGTDPPGRRLYESAAALANWNGAVIRVAPVVCLANCERGCSVAVSAPGKWAYVMGGLDDSRGADLLLYGAAYARSESGTVLREHRPQSLRHAVIARLPTLPLDDEGRPA